MTIKSVTLSAVTPVSTPTTVNGIAISGYVDDVPCQFLRLANGRVKPAIGATLQTSYGTGTVTGYTDNNKIRVSISQFNDDFEFINADETDIYGAEEFVKRAASSLNVGVESSRETFTRLFKSDITGVLTKRNEERMERAFPLFACNEVVTSAYKDLNGTAPVIVRMVPKCDRQHKLDQALKARSERRQRLLDRARATMAECAPDDVAADIRDAFGE